MIAKTIMQAIFLFTALPCVVVLFNGMWSKAIFNAIVLASLGADLLLRKYCPNRTSCVRHVMYSDGHTMYYTSRHTTSGKCNLGAALHCSCWIGNLLLFPTASPAHPLLSLSN